MIRFIDKDGVLFNGSSPYVHWVEGQQSTNMIYPLKLMVISDNPSLTVEIPENDVFKLIDTNNFTDNQTVELSNIVTNSITLTSSEIIDGYYLYQIILIVSSESEGQMTEHLTITGGDEIYDIIVGGDFYGLNEILEINLENRGLELPVTIQKAIFESDIHNDIVDNILINRKFKELISNYLDIVDCKGSYKSLYNSLQWFEWGDYAKLYEIWEFDKGQYLQKDMELTLNGIYESLLSSARKTTHIALTAALNRLLNGDDIPGFDSMSHDEKIEALFDFIYYSKDGVPKRWTAEPKLKEVVERWSKDDLYVKIIILGAFFERYFMPIHLDLKRTAMEALVYYSEIGLGNGSLYRNSNFIYDTGIVDIEMDHVVTLGNIDGYGVGPYTMFGIKNIELRDPVTQVIEPVGVEPISDVSSTLPASVEGLKWDPASGEPVDETLDPVLDPDTGLYEYTKSILQWNIDKDNPEDNVGWEGSDVIYDEHDDARITYAQFGGNVGVIVPVKVTINLPNDDAINRAEIYVYRGSDTKSMPDKPSQYVIEKQLWRPVNNQISLNFNLLSTKEEVVSFVLVFYSLSGHVWTACSSYESIDVSGSYLNIYKVKNTDNSEDSETKVYDTINANRGWLHGKPYGIQYNTIDIQGNAEEDMTSIYGDLVQYIPTADYEQLNEMFLIENTNIWPTTEQDSTVMYDVDWIKNFKNDNNKNIDESFWVFPRGEIDSVGNNRYFVIISKSPGNIYETNQSFVEFILNEFNYEIDINKIKRHDFIFLPQLHQYTNIEDVDLEKDEITGRYIMTENDYAIKRGTLLSIIPQFKRTVLMDPDSIKWEFTNVSKPGTVITYKQPVSTIMIADNVYKDLTPGYWTITMYYKMVGSSEEHKLTKNSAFKIVA